MASQLLLVIYNQGVPQIDALDEPVGGEIVIYQQYQKVSYRRFYRWILPSKEGLPVYAKALSIYRHFAPKLIGIVLLPSAGNTS
jgi:hypothetical protein